jgi:23S rRNA pseudouridine2605 synthase
VAEIRLQKVIAQSGVASRREAERLIASGRVMVNSKVVKTQGIKVDPDLDKVSVDGEVLTKNKTSIYLILNKPQGVLAASSDPQGRKTVFDLLDHKAAARGSRRVFHVGRLDYNSEGLLLLTNDGALTNVLTHPSSGVPRIYRVRVQGTLKQKSLDRLCKGVRLEDGPAKVDSIKVTKRNRKSTWVRLQVREGRNRLVRRLFNELNHQVLRLVRISYGGVELGDLTAGKVRSLTPEEIATLRTWKKVKSDRKGRSA